MKHDEFSQMALDKRGKFSAKRELKNWIFLAYLSTAFDDIKWANGGMGKTASEDTSSHALGIIGHVMNVTHFCC